MKRRTFTKLAGFSAIAFSASGFVHFNGKNYEGDCETTSDILGPFYRPNSPVRNNLVIQGAPGELVELVGVVNHKDCTTPFKNAKVELWHCSADEIYDNDTDEYRYRGTTYCDENGNYRFLTQMPVPYSIGNGVYRPAHFHMMVSAEGYQSLITQIYFTGDPHLSKDSSTTSPKAAGRILEVEEGNGMKRVAFNINMNDKLLASIGALEQIVGKYQRNDEDSEVLELFHKDNYLWMKNEVFGRRFDYLGENTFAYSGTPTPMSWKIKFDLSENGMVKLVETQLGENGVKKVFHYTKKV